MKYFTQRRRGIPKKGFGDQAFSDNDPMTGVANLFDLGLVFIVGLIMAVFSVYHLQDLFTESSEFTIMKQDSRTDEMEIITKKGKKVTALKVSREKAEGRGERLGVAYRLEDGTFVYVPE